MKKVAKWFHLEEVKSNMLMWTVSIKQSITYYLLLNEAEGLNDRDAKALENYVEKKIEKNTKIDKGNHIKLVIIDDFQEIKGREKVDEFFKKLKK